MREAVEHYYGKVLSNSSDLLTDACTTGCAPAPALQALVDQVHPEVRARYYGCGLVYPDALHDTRILDLGCGSGQDCYVLAQLTGEHGAVVGVDMTEEQLETARVHADWHADRFGYANGNVSFFKAYIEQLDELPLEANSFDVIVSNCVINLSIDKPAVLRGAWELLKPGGEMYFSDVYADRRVPAEAASDPVLYGECLGGALYWNDFERLAREAGFAAPRLVEDAVLSIRDASVAERLAGIGFHTATYRLFKIDGLEPDAEDYGQAVIYRGGIAGSESGFRLDKHHFFERGRAVPVCGNTFRMLNESRFAAFFDCLGGFDMHFGPFEARTKTVFEQTTSAPTPTASGGCC